MARLRESLVAAHASALAAQEAMQYARLAEVTRSAGLPARYAAPQIDSRSNGSGPHAQHGTARIASPPAADQQTALPAAVVPTPIQGPARHFVVTIQPDAVVATEITAPGERRYPEPATTEGAFKALARTTASALTRQDLDHLRAGAIATVFGRPYDQQGLNPEIRLHTPTHGALTQVTHTTRRAGEWNHGTLHATAHLTDFTVTAVTEVALQAAQVIALNLGLHLCLPDAEFTAQGAEVELAAPVTGDVDVALALSDLDMIPRPRLTAEVTLHANGITVAKVHGLKLEVRERPGVPIGPEQGGAIPRDFGRRNADGKPALLNEFHMIHSSRGDLAITLGPEFARTAGRRATRMPSGGLRLCDRVMHVDGERHKLARAAGDTEYDSPADSWYYAETANASMPNVIYMETSLQSALLLGYYLGATLTDPNDDFSLRNLDGSATVLREVDLRDKTIQQHSELTNTSVLSGAVLQSFTYELSVDGEPFYRGESLFGFFNERALANQTGLDGGAYVPTWLERQASAPRVRTIAVGRRGTDGPARSTAHLHLIDEVQVVDGGGDHGLGYLRAVKPIRETDWFFRRHFHLDPVMPGSLGVEAVIQAMQEWLVDAGLADGLVAPEFVLPAGLPLSWRYRGQILATDGEMTLEVHLKRVERGDQRVRVVADASVWKPGMRIYQLDDVAVECRGVGAK
ncbi:beta-hydroxydecanoyl-ACP dehydratase [Actinokineospora auranticolor]|uniref:beta-hydroxydecanoyl-ACP dehydratase n=1 Tax=Actinokineospora auranticolor TaxID=155976 RepID=UPI001CA4ABD3|nr:beta-hydroxydecanoyl-ACP dehydratase [Actinokineospora auranticolor]